VEGLSTGLAKILEDGLPPPEPLADQLPNHPVAEEKCEQENNVKIGLSISGARILRQKLFAPSHPHHSAMLSARSSQRASCLNAGSVGSAEAT